MRALFDSTVLLAHLRGIPGATDLIRAAAAGGSAYASVLSRAELEGGMRSAERADVARLFSALEMVPVSDAIATDAGSLLRKYRRSHPGIDLADYVIDATARSLDADLLTLNIKHFPHRKGLRPAF